MLKPGLGSRLPQLPSPQPSSAQPEQPAPNLQDNPPNTLPSQKSNGRPPLPRTQFPRNRHRYSFKTRTGATNPPPPFKMKLYKFKPYKEPEAKDELEPSSDESKPKPKPKTKLKTLSDSSAATRKLAITRLLQYQHPTSTLNVGTLSANLRRALPNDGTVQQEVALCIRNAVREAARIRRQGQRVIGKFVEHVNKHGPGPNDHRFMNFLCPRVSIKDAKKLDDGCAAEDDDEDGGDMDQKSKDGKGSEQFLFLQSFLSYLYSGNYPRKSGTGQKVNDFIDRLKDLGLYAPPRPRAALNETTPFSPTELLLSVALQLKVELKKIYRNGTCELHNKLQKRKKKGLLGSDVNVEIQEEVSAIENYLAINKLSPNPRRIIPMSTAKQSFVSFTERQLAMFFFNRGGALRARVQELVGTVCTSMQDVEEWIGGKKPGFLIKHLIVDIDSEDLTSRQRGKAGHRAAIVVIP
ncbi:hypothetical protein BC939DRAFT_221112 [Gamsiella multidivaricata]|uniref:uncharacterized protein n=1 Tax=Gamsiella multidivaricata TaxID=101098 RepID=UPI00221F08A7|nr:uncharacterized protein BC939DRAFT_221112 [Gamsiella multidivaricata]KAI7831143.1 hypothetical protein BC939DRAFT_221112 [Gamsiella multidivaricata]